MYSKVKRNKRTSLKVNTSVEGQTIEQKIEAIVNNKEPIKGESTLAYTERRDGVRAEYDIRTDKFDLAIDAMDYVAKSAIAKREDSWKQADEAKVVKLKTESSEEQKDGGTESI